MDASGCLKSFILALILISSGCDSGGGNGENGSNDPFSPDSYKEATSANESLSGIWIALEHSKTSTKLNGDNSVIETSEEYRRELYVVADTDASPAGQPSFSDCFRSDSLSVSNNNIEFSINGFPRIAERKSNTRINGSFDTSSVLGSFTKSVTGQFTLIKLAPLPTGLLIDATAGEQASYFDYLNPIGSIEVIAPAAVFSGSITRPIDTSGAAYCFMHSEGARSGSSPSGPYNFANKRFIAKGAGEDVLSISENHGAGVEGVSIDGRSSGEGFVLLDGTNEIVNAPIQGAIKLTVEASILGTIAGDAEASINITLP
jgi:hypothetical protein